MGGRGSKKSVRGGWKWGYWRAVKLYVKSWCPWCVDAERWLARRGLSFERVDVLEDGSAYSRMRRLSGQSLTPTLEMPDGGVLADFDVGELEGFLRRRGMLPS
jgi:glutaredoxin 3